MLENGQWNCSLLAKQWQKAEVINNYEGSKTWLNPLCSLQCSRRSSPTELIKKETTNNRPHCLHNILAPACFQNFPVQHSKFDISCPIFPPGLLRTRFILLSLHQVFVCCTRASWPPSGQVCSGRKKEAKYENKAAMFEPARGLGHETALKLWSLVNTPPCLLQDASSVSFC